MCDLFRMKYVLQAVSPSATHCVKTVHMSDSIMSFNSQLTEILIRKMCMNVMRIFVDKDETWLKSKGQISAA